MGPLGRYIVSFTRRSMKPDCIFGTRVSVKIQLDKNGFSSRRHLSSGFTVLSRHQ